VFRCSQPARRSLLIARLASVRQGAGWAKGHLSLTICLECESESDVPGGVARQGDLVGTGIGSRLSVDWQGLHLRERVRDGSQLCSAGAGWPTR